MTRKEKIIEILKSKTAQNLFHFRFQMFSEAWYEELADAILALPIEVPSEEEINEYARRESIVQVEEDGELIDYESCLDEYYIEGAKWAINEILKRNEID